jgi:hypothetical protein
MKNFTVLIIGLAALALSAGNAFSLTRDQVKSICGDQFSTGCGSGYCLSGCAKPCRTNHVCGYFCCSGRKCPGGKAGCGGESVIF